MTLPLIPPGGTFEFSGGACGRGIRFCGRCPFATNGKVKSRSTPARIFFKTHVDITTPLSCSTLFGSQSCGPITHLDAPGRLQGYYCNCKNHKATKAVAAVVSSVRNPRLVTRAALMSMRRIPLRRTTTSISLGQPDHEFRSTLGKVAPGNLAAVTLNDSLRDGKSQASAAPFS